MPDDLDQIMKAAGGLLYPSESDQPFEPVRWKDRPKFDGDVHEQSLEEFFAELEKSEEAEKWRNLRNVIQTRLSPVNVYRVGEVRVDIFIVGKTRQGSWVGLRTQSVET